MHENYSFDTGTFLDENGSVCKCTLCSRYVVVDSAFDDLDTVVMTLLTSTLQIFTYARNKVFQLVACPSCHAPECIKTESMHDLQEKVRIGTPLCYACGNCISGCCNCFLCHCTSRTARHSAGWCALCNRCERCDTCPRCRSCTRTYNRQRYCAGCTNCSRCCRCPVRPDTPSVPVPYVNITTQPHHKVTKILRRVNPIDRLVSVEIEVAGVRGRAPENVTEICRKWGANIVRDGSLPQYGFEINTAPAAGDLFVKEITDITDTLASQFAFANEQCGLHCHVDARDFTFFDMRRLIFLYEKIEPALFSMVPATRRRSKYCYPCGPRYSKNLRESTIPKMSKNQIYRGIYGLDGSQVQDRKKIRTDQARYNALNIHSWFVRGTTECRIRHGTVDRQEIINWGMLWAGILDYAIKTPETNIHKLSHNTMEERKGVLKLCAPTGKVVDFIDSEFAKYNPSSGEIALSYRTFNA